MTQQEEITNKPESHPQQTLPEICLRDVELSLCQQQYSKTIYVFKRKGTRWTLANAWLDAENNRCDMHPFGVWK
jgi:hypothetical protein